MTTVQATKDPLLKGVPPTPSKIPVLSQRRPPFPMVKPCAVDQENQDPKKWMQKPNLSIQRPLLDSAGPRPKTTHQTDTSQRLVGITELRNPLEELRPNPGGQNVGPGPPPQKEAPGAIEFVADPAALATILSGEGVKSCQLGCRPSLAKRVLVRGSQGGTIRRGQSARSSAYLAPRTPTHRLDPTRASCFSRLEGSGPRGRTLFPQRLETLISPSGSSFYPSTGPSFQELRRETGGSSRTSVSEASGLLMETPVQRASSLPKGEHEVVTHSDEGRVASLGLAQRVPLRETQKITHTRDSCDSHLMPSPSPVAQPMHGHKVPPSVTRPSPFGRAQRVSSPGFSALNSYSVLRRLAVRPKIRFTPMPSVPRVQQTRCLSGLSPQPCPEEPTLPWEDIAVRLFDQESCVKSLGGPGKLPAPTPSGPYPSGTPSLPELKMQRIGILQQLLRQEVEGLAGGQCTPLTGGSPLDMVELQPLLTEISETLKDPEHNSGTSHVPGLLEHSGQQTKPCLPEQCEEPHACPSAEPGTPESCRSEPEIPQPSLEEQLEVSEPCPLVESRPQGPTGSSEPCPEVEPRKSEACSLERRNPESSPPPCCIQWAPATTSLIFSSQHPLCASPPIHSIQSLRLPAGQAGKEFVGKGYEERMASSLRASWAPALHHMIPCFLSSALYPSPSGKGEELYLRVGSVWWEYRIPESPLHSPWPSGPSSLAPRTLALRQRLKACLTAIHCFHEARLDDECAFYTSRAPPLGPTRVCTNPVATLLEWQDALCFVPVGSAAPQGSPS
ncbi:tastin isoform X2 [Nycticebus coucang]|nr:tastin isoform X2 [Nycticebus coucang]